MAKSEAQRYEELIFMYNKLVLECANENDGTNVTMLLVVSYELVRDHDKNELAGFANSSTPDRAYVDSFRL